MFVKILILISCLIYNATSVIDWLGARQGCLMKTNVTDNDLLQESQTAMCYYFCMYQEYGLMRDNGDFSITYLTASVQNFTDDGTSLVIWCQMMNQQKDICERAFKRRKCLRGFYDLCLYT